MTKIEPTKKQIKQIEELFSMKHYRDNVFVRPKSKNCDYALYVDIVNRNHKTCVENVENGNITKYKYPIYMIYDLNKILDGK